MLSLWRPSFDSWSGNKHVCDAVRPKYKKRKRKKEKTKKKQKTGKKRENNLESSPRSLTCKQEYHKQRTLNTEKGSFINKIKEYFPNLKSKNLQIESELQVGRCEKIYSHQSTLLCNFKSTRNKRNILPSF